MRISRFTALWFACLALAVICGCSTRGGWRSAGAADMYLTYFVDTDPPGAWVYKEGDLVDRRRKLTCYVQPVTATEIARGRIEFPALIIEKPAYKKRAFNPMPFVLDAAAVEYIRSGGKYQNSGKIELEPDPDFKGPEDPNEALVTVKSRPGGARIYQDGRFVGVAPLVLHFAIGNDCYDSGMLRCPSLIASRDACFASRLDLELKVDPKWRYESGEQHEYAAVFTLKRNPGYRTAVFTNAPKSLGGATPSNPIPKEALDPIQIPEQSNRTVRTLGAIH